MSNSEDNLTRLHSSTSWLLARWALGLFLLVAAWLKWQAFGVGPGTVLFDIAPAFEWALIQCEVLLALWLFSGWRPSASWLCSLLLFSVFWGASTALVLQGNSSCGCLGNADFHPLWMLCLDLAVVGWLIAIGWSNELYRGLANWMRPIAMAPVAVAVVLGCAGTHWSDQVSLAYARMLPVSLTGRVLVTEPPIVKADTGQAGEWRTLRFAVRNQGAESVRLIGAEEGCKCRAIESLPVDIPAGEQVTVTVEVKLGSKNSFWILTSSDRQRRLMCRWKSDGPSLTQVFWRGR